MADVYVYRLIEPTVLVERADALRDQLAASAGAGMAESSFRMSPASGCFKWFAAQSPRAASPTPKKPQEAMRAAMTFFTAVNGAAETYRARVGVSASEYPSPFPVRALRHVRTSPIRMHADGAPQRSFAAPDQDILFWRSVWLVFLPADMPEAAAKSSERDPVAVFGASVEAAIGPGGRIQSVVSTVRPWVGVRRVTAFPPPHHGSDHPHAISKVYVADGSEEPQAFLAPYYVDPHASDSHSHGTVLRPACDHALIVDMIVVSGEEGGRVLPVVMDRDGEMVEADPRTFKASWFYARLEDTLTGEVTISSDHELRINGIGLFHIELTVEHYATGAVRSTFRNIPLGGSAPVAVRSI